MDNGWVILHRKICENELWLQKPFSKGQAWIDLFLNANHTKGGFWVRGKFIDIERGQIGWSEITMSKRWGWSKNKTRRYLKWLETEHQIEQQKNSFTTIVTVLKYDEYQNMTERRNTKRYTKKTPNDTQTTNDNKELTNDKQIRATLKDKFETDKYPKENYVKILNEYQRLKGVRLQGQEYLPPMKVIKQMFQSGREVTQIIETMGICEENYEDWSMNTVKMKIADVVGGKLRGKDKTKPLTLLGARDI